MGWKAKPPDTSAISAAAQQQSALGQEYLGLQREELARAREREERFDPLYQQFVQQSMATAETQRQRGDQIWEQYQSTAAPAMQRMADNAANYDNGGRRDQAESEAMASVGRQFEAGRAARGRDLSRAGVQLGSGRALTLDNQSRIAQAKASTAAGTTARRQVEGTGMALTSDVARMGQGLSGGSMASNQLALGATGAAAGALGQSQAGYNASLNPAMTAMSGAGSAHSSAGNLFSSEAQIKAGGGDNSGLGMLGNLAGSFLGSVNWSSGKLKHRGAKVNGKRALRELAAGAVDAEVKERPVPTRMPNARGLSRLDNEHWRYKKGVADEGEHVGPIAESVQREFGDEVAPGGRMIHMPGMADKRGNAVAELHAEVESLKRELAELEVA